MELELRKVTVGQPFLQGVLRSLYALASHSVMAGRPAAAPHLNFETATSLAVMNSSSAGSPRSVPRCRGGSRARFPRAR